ncbi:hypothetical protein JKI95_02475 [Corynebacterium aquatimens]|uniref:hypothetical protein n=1 Tax=Corynebacterium TaxID=1716 RepID=UPI001F268BE1|nr:MULTISPECIES: hypothetical protein [Corynebacterium]QYH19955.1 hypothetical protein JKI95_02475 [Corynebacterium aquatimens]UIZ92866.1 hypothetical protein JZY91_03695 [Corynebacterium sp. CNCTC7651]
MQNDPAKPGYTTDGSTNKPVDHDEDQFAQDTGSALGYGEEAEDGVEDAQLTYEISQEDEGDHPTIEK